MVAGPLPIAFAVLERERDRAVDRALYEALAHMQPHVQDAALKTLAKRGEAQILAQIVWRYHAYPDALRRIILDHAGSLTSGVRTAINSATYDHRVAAVEFVANAKAAPLIDALADALRSSCEKTRTLAADALHDLSNAVLDEGTTASTTSDIQRRAALADALAETLAIAVHRWERDRQPKILQAAMALADRTEAALRKKLAQPQTKIAGELMEVVRASHHPRLAGFVLRALGIPDLRSAAARLITESSHTSFLDALVREAWILSDPRVVKGCHSIGDGPWMEQIPAIAASVTPSAVPGAVRLVAAAGGTRERRLDRMRSLIDTGRETVRSAVTWRLIDDPSDTANDLLTLIAARPGDSAARLASRELRRRGRHVVRSEATRDAPPGPLDGTAADPFDAYWANFEDLTPSARDEFCATARERRDAFDRYLGIKLKSPDTLVQLRALRMIATANAAEAHADAITRFAHDANPVIRSVAVRLLGTLPGATSERLVRAALHDPDHRVQANAVETLEELGEPDRIGATEPLLESSNSRVRANAIKALLALDLVEAGEALLDMLDDPSPSHRLSALWVMDCLQSRAALHRLVELSVDDPDERVRSRAGRLVQSLAAEPVAAIHP